MVQLGASAQRRKRGNEAYLSFPHENMIGSMAMPQEVYKQTPRKARIKLHGHSESRRSVKPAALEYEIYRHLLPGPITAWLM